MKKLTLKRGDEEYCICFTNSKIIIGNNYFRKFEMMKIFREYFNNSTSEYSENRNLISKVLINDSIVNLKKCFFIDVSPNFDLNTDLKMGSKSLTLKYLETVLENEVLFDSMNTINILFSSLEEEMNILQDNLSVSLCDFNIKIIQKLITTLLIKDGEKINMYNLSYEEVIILLLNMISEITNKSHFEESFVLLDIPILTDRIYSSIEQIRSSSIFVFTNDYPKTLSIDKIYNYSTMPLDFADDEQLYSVLCEEHNLAYELKEIKKMLKKYINSIKDTDTELISKILE